jgi:hypothetical protein
MSAKNKDTYKSEVFIQELSKLSLKTTAIVFFNKQVFSKKIHFSPTTTEGHQLSA